MDAFFLFCFFSFVVGRPALDETVDVSCLPIYCCQDGGDRGPSSCGSSGEGEITALWYQITVQWSVNEIVKCDCCAIGL